MKRPKYGVNHPMRGGVIEAHRTGTMPMDDYRLSSVLLLLYVLLLSLVEAQPTCPTAPAAGCTVSPEQEGLSCSCRHVWAPPEYGCQFPVRAQLHWNERRRRSTAHRRARRRAHRRASSRLVGASACWRNGDGDDRDLAILLVRHSVRPH